MSKKLFLSAVSSEFESYRQLLAKDLKRPTLDVAVQEDFVTSGGSTLEKLDDYIRSCDGVVHLIGKATGSAPAPVAVQALLNRYTDLAVKLPALAESLKQPDPRFSYTQWEAYLAICHQRPIFIYRPTDFALAECHCPRDAGFVRDPVQEQAQEAHYRRICALGRDRGQFANQERLSSAVLRDLVDILPALESRIEVPPTKLRHTAEVLLGRDTDLTLLDEAWNDRKNVVVVRGKGGEGKTSLVASWMAELAMKGWRGAENVFDWTFYSQGTKDQSAATADVFISAALGYFGDPDPTHGGPDERGARLARLVGARRCLLVLDGLEPLQYPPGPMHGQLKDPGMAALLRGLAGQNAGLCVVTTREKIDEIKQHYDKSAIDHPLEVLSPEAGAALLHYSGARRAGTAEIEPDDPELQLASWEVHGHALTLALVGQYLKLTEGGDIRRRDRMKLAEAEAEYKNDATRPYGHAFKAIEAYEVWFAAGDDEARRQLAILRLLALFDRPAPAGCLATLCAKKISGLNEAVVGVSKNRWKVALGRLQEINLIGVGADGSVDCHPLIREYFATQLKARSPKAFRVAHSRLFDYLCKSTTEYQPDTLAGLQPLYQAVVHGCLAGRQQEACDRVYFYRILRGTGPGGFYSWKKLGAFGANLGAVAAFFEDPWRRLSPKLRAAVQALLFNEAAIYLRALGRLTEAVEPMRVGLEMQIAHRVWESAAVIAFNLSELEVTLGRLGDAEADGRRAIAFADRSGGAFCPSGVRAAAAAALHQAGERAEAGALLADAERVQADREPFPLLYSLPGFLYVDLIMGPAEHAAWRRVIERHFGGPAIAVSGEPPPIAGDAAEATSGQPPDGRAANASGGGRPHSKTLSAARVHLRIQTWNLEPLSACAEAEQRGRQALNVVLKGSGNLLDIALNHLTLARAGLYRSLLERAVGATFAPAVIAATSAAVETALGKLRQANQIQFLPLALLTAALHAGAVAGRADEARHYLDEAQLIAERGPMPLHLADVHLHRARLFHDRVALAEARRLIEAHGYGRRREELADALAAAAHWPP